MSAFGWDSLGIVTEDRRLADVAIVPERTTGPGAVVTWYLVTERQRVVTIAKVLADTPQRFRWRDDRGRVFELVPMTVARYNAIRSRGSRAVRSVRELRELLEPEA